MLQNELKKVGGGERALRKAELAKMDEQISYYDSLLRDMKRELRPADRSSILSKG